MKDDNKKVLIHFDGVRVAKDYMTGVVTSDELIFSFGASWVPQYQRDRVMSKNKIESLKQVFLRGGKIDSVKLNLVGEYIKEGRQAVLSGYFRVIDGQQRLWALKESGAKGINIPVELYLNISEDEEIKLFHQFNRDPSKLLLGDLAKSTGGSFSKIALRKALSDKNYPVKVNVNSRTGGINLSVFSSLLYMTYRRLFLKTTLAHSPSGKAVLSFLGEDFPGHEVQLCEFAARNLLMVMVRVFGTYDAKATAYSRKFMVPLFNVLIANFLTDQGQLNFKSFKGKVLDLPKLLNNARMREILKGDETLIYGEIVKFLNFKNKTNRLPTLDERIAADDRSENLSRTSRKAAETAKIYRSTQKSSGTAVAMSAAAKK